MCKKEEKQIAFSTGMKNNLTVIYLDVYNPHKPKDDKYKDMEEDEYGVGLFMKLMEIDDFELDDCIVIQTPSGGYHIYGEYFKEVPITNENQVRDINLNSAISSIEDEEEYVEMIVDTDLLSTVLSKLKKERFESYDSWIRIGFIVFNELGSKGFDIWHSFSKRASNYKSEQDCRYHWNTFAKRAKKLTIRSLFYYLKEDNKKAFNELSKEYYRAIKLSDVEAFVDQNAYYMDYLKQKE
jgi:hypothetical protein